VEQRHHRIQMGVPMDNVWLPSQFIQIPDDWHASVLNLFCHVTEFCAECDWFMSASEQTKRKVAHVQL